MFRSIRSTCSRFGRLVPFQVLPFRVAIWLALFMQDKARQVFARAKLFRSWPNRLVEFWIFARSEGRRGGYDSDNRWLAWLRI